MSGKKSSKFGRFRAGFAGFLVLIGMLIGITGVLNRTDVYAVPNDATLNSLQSDADGEDSRADEIETTDETQASTSVVSDDASTNKNNEKTGDACKESLGALGWIVCPVMDKVATAVDSLYHLIEDFLVINPISTEDGTPVYEIWKYCRGFTNIVFIIFLLVVIYSQITGYGISNYGVKKALPKLIVASVMVNLSFLICLLAVDVSNIIGMSIRGLFNTVQESALVASGAESAAVSYGSVLSALIGGSLLSIGGVAIAFETGAIWMLIPVILGAIVAVASGLITIALRQAVVILLIMISPLAMVANMLPNTEQWFKKWKGLFTRMLVFYPMFSLLFGASSLAGFAIIMSAKGAFGVILGIAVQIFPLFFSWSLMKMSGTFLGDINSRIRGITGRPLATNRAWADSHRQSTRQKMLASDARRRTPSVRLMQFIDGRRVGREEDISDNVRTARNRALAARAGRNFKGREEGTGVFGTNVLAKRNATGAPTRRGERAYKQIGQNLEYQRAIERSNNTMNRGLGNLAGSTAQKERLDRLDHRVMTASDMLKVEKSRGEKIEYENAVGFHDRMEKAINAHMDVVNGFEIKDGIEQAKTNYKFHIDPDKLKNSAELARYNAAMQIMDGSAVDVQFAAAGAAQAYDTQNKIYASKMQKYFELAPPTVDVVGRLNEMTKLSADDLSNNVRAASNIDAIVSGLRILNQRGDTDLVKAQIDNLLDKNIGGGIQLGTHASQALASFLMFEVKDSDPALRRFGKYINLETARTYNSNDRKAEYVDYNEYIKGYHVEPNGEVMYAKKDAKKLLEGTSLDNIERTALANLDDSLKKAYGYVKGSNAEWDVSGYLKRREEIQTAFEPAFLSSSLKWLSGSEQINSGVKFWTGYELKQKKDENGKLVIGPDNEPEYDLSPVWKEKEFAGHEDEIEKYFRKKTYDYFKDQTTGQILNMRTDYREPTVEHLLEMYFEDDATGGRRQEFENAKAEIQTRYGDESDATVQKRKRSNDLSALKRKLAGEQLRKILDKTGKLEQIYNTRRSGTAINAKDWLRKMLNLDDKDEIYKYLDEKDRQREANREQQTTSGEADLNSSIYGGDSGFRTRLMAELNDTFEKTGDSADPDEDFFARSMEKIVAEFGAESEVAGLYKDYREHNTQAGRGEMFEELEKILDRFFAGNS